MDADTAVAGTAAPDTEAEREITPASIIPGHGQHVAADVDTTEFENPFDFLFEDLAAAYPAKHLPISDPATVVTKLRALGKAMVDAVPPTPEDDSDIPGVYTYWGQFVDHDITANTDRDNAAGNVALNPQPLPPRDVVDKVENLRHPALNLDSLYGPGSKRDGDIKMAVGTVALKDKNGNDIPGERIEPTTDLKRDLPRSGVKAQLGDPRNDENLIVAQLHTAFLKFHNVAADWVAERHPDWKRHSIWVRAKKLTQWHYQWLTVNDFLREITLPGVVDSIMLGERTHSVRREGKLFMPLEFSTAAFRFGHSMVRGGYDFNRNFGQGVGGVPPLKPFASFEDLFTFTGNDRSPFADQSDLLPFNWVADWNRLASHTSPNPGHFARKIDTGLVDPLHTMVNQGLDPAPPEGPLTPPVKEILKNLAMRNLVRGYVLAMPTGQAVAEALGVEPLTHDELTTGDAGVAQALTDGSFLDATPLWFYVLKEAEVRANGNSLGEVGSRIVAETIIGHLFEDPNSYVHRDWTPAEGVRLTEDSDGHHLIVTVRDFLKAAGVL